MKQVTFTERPTSEVWDIAAKEHNKYRRKRGSRVELKGDVGMHEEAQRYCEYLASTNQFEPTTLGKYGNNLACSFRDRTQIAAVKDAIKSWYAKKKDMHEYELDSTHFGIGVAWSEWNKRWIIVAFYNRPNCIPRMRGGYEEGHYSILRPSSAGS